MPDSPAFGQANLTNCERELIHLAGSVQPHGAVLVLRERDRVVPPAAVAEMAVKTKLQKGIKLTHEIVPGANHFFEQEGTMAALKEVVGDYVDTRMVDILASRKDD